MFRLGDRVRILYGVTYNGYDLTDKTGIIKDLESYVQVYIPDLNITVKMFRHEIEDDLNIFDEITLDNIGSLF